MPTQNPPRGESHLARAQAAEIDGDAPLTPLAVADRCRALIVALMNGGPEGLSRRELVDWLTQYHELAVWVEGAPRPADAHRRRSPIDRVHLLKWLGDATSGVSIGVENLRDPFWGRSFTLDATVDEWIVPFTDPFGRRGWRPTDGRHRTLSERALALLAADYLMRPADYERSIQKCPRCTRIWFVGRASVAATRTCGCRPAKTSRPKATNGKRRATNRPAAQAA